MPTLPASLRSLLADGKLTESEASSLSSAEVGAGDLRKLATSYGDLFSAGAGNALKRAAAARGVSVVVRGPIRSLGDHPASAAVLRGEVTLRSGSSSEAALHVQRALNAIANRSGNASLALLTSGADGAFGTESSTAVRIFQSSVGLPATGEVDQETAMRLEAELVARPPPNVGGVGATASLPDGEAIARAARDLVARRGADYGTAAVWRSPNPNIPGNRNPGVTSLGVEGRWKCNLFGLDALYLGGAEPPQYRTSTGEKGYYPIAVEIHNFAKGSSPALSNLGRIDLRGLTPAEKQRRVDALLRIARPGDIVTVDHPGPATVDGGHTRVVLANRMAADGTVEFAAASSSSAITYDMTPRQIAVDANEDFITLVRPIRRRAAGSV